MNDKYSEAVRATLRRSGIAIALVILAGGFTAGLMLALPMPLAARVLLATWAACTALHALDRALRPRRLRCDCEGAAEVDGVEGRLQHPCFVAPWLTVVRWRPHGALFDRTVLVLPGMLPAEDFRRLRVLLRWR
jgi:toxin CptA